MGKLKLNLDEIKVESFNIQSEEAKSGTVLGAMEAASANGGYCFSDAGWECTFGTTVAISWAGTCIKLSCLGGTETCGCGASGGDYSNCTNCTHNALC